MSANTNQDEQEKNSIRAKDETKSIEKTSKSNNQMDKFFATLSNDNSRDNNQSSKRRFRKRSRFKKDSRMDDKSSVSNIRQSTFDSTLSVSAGEKARTEKIKKASSSASFFEEVDKIIANTEAQRKTNESTNLTTTNSSLANGRKTSDSTKIAKTTTATSSILDLMPPTPRTRSPDSFPEESYDQYSQILDFILTDSFFNRKKKAVRLNDAERQSVVDWLRAESPMVKYKLPSFVSRMASGEKTSDFDEKEIVIDLSMEMEEQEQRFKEHYGWNSMQYELATMALLRVGNICAKRTSGLPAQIGWEKLKEAGFVKRKDLLENYLYVTSTFLSQPPSRSQNAGGSIFDFLDKDGEVLETPPVNNDCNSESSAGNPDIANEIATIHDIFFGASEQSTSIRIRQLVAQGRASQAEQLLENNTTSELRLRTCDPIFQCYLEQKEMAAALKLYTKMKAEETVHLKPETYIQLMAGIAENGFFRGDSSPVEGAEQLGYKYSSGPKFFDILASELADDAIEISASAAKRLFNALVIGFENHNLSKLHLLQSLEVCTEAAAPSELVASRVILDEETGKCPRTGIHLRLINLNDQQKEKLKEGLVYLAGEAYYERTGDSPTMAEKGLRDFGSWLMKRKSDPFTAIVDGANVGYYFQNFDEGRFNYHQIEFVVNTLEEMGENVLITIPKKYTQNNFTLMKSSGPKKQFLTKKEKEIRDRLISSGKLYVVPPSMLDDYYWMYASVAGQGEKFPKSQQYLPPNNEDGRWPGIRPMLVSNDKMRDHKLSLLEPRLFRRWYSNFLVNYTFSAFVGEHCHDKDIGFRTADFYSREIQGNTADIDGDSGTVWHFPISDWENNESFCVRLPEA